MTTVSNKALMQRFTQFINTASEELAGELISPDAMFYVPGRADPMRGPTGYLAIIGMMRGGCEGKQKSIWPDGPEFHREPSWNEAQVAAIIQRA